MNTNLRIETYRSKLKQLDNDPEQYFKVTMALEIVKIENEIKNKQPEKKYLERLIADCAKLPEKYLVVKDFVWPRASWELSKLGIKADEEHLCKVKGMVYSEQWKEGEIRRLRSSMKQVYDLENFGEEKSIWDY